VILPGAVVRSGASVVRAVVDDEVEVAAGVGEEGGEIALVGLRAKVTEQVPAGGRFPEVEGDE
jgi:glucose-1-phosphate adenylyltransferase